MYLKPTSWRSISFIQGYLFLKVCSFVRLVFKSGLWWCKYSIFQTIVPTLHYTLFLGRDHHIQTMVRTITCQVPLVSDKAMSARVATTVEKMAPLSNSGGQLLLRNSEIHSTMNSVQRPLVALSEAETQWTCSAFKGHASAISVTSSIRTLVLCLLLFSIMIRWS